VAEFLLDTGTYEYLLQEIPYKDPAFFNTLVFIFTPIVYNRIYASNLFGIVSIFYSKMKILLYYIENPGYNERLIYQELIPFWLNEITYFEERLDDFLSSFILVVKESITFELIKKFIDASKRHKMKYSISFTSNRLVQIVLKVKRFPAEEIKQLFIKSGILSENLRHCSRELIDMAIRTSSTETVLALLDQGCIIEHGQEEKFRESNMPKFQVDEIMTKYTQKNYALDLQSLCRISISKHLVIENIPNHIISPTLLTFLKHKSLPSTVVIGAERRK